MSREARLYFEDALTAHGYFGIDSALLWRIVGEDVPSLVSQLRKQLGSP